MNNIFSVLICDRKTGLLNYSMSHNRITSRSVEPFLKPILAAKFTSSVLILGSNYQFYVVKLDLKTFFSFKLNKVFSAIPNCMEITRLQATFLKYNLLNSKFEIFRKSSKFLNSNQFFYQGPDCSRLQFWNGAVLFTRGCRRRRNGFRPVDSTQPHVELQ